VSVGHIARAAEKEGIPTVAVVVRSFRHVVHEMGYPRAVITHHPMGRPLGPPGEVATQKRVVGTALDLLESATQGGTVVELDEPYRPISSS
jgi:hypothetical protein